MKILKIEKLIKLKEDIKKLVPDCIIFSNILLGLSVVLKVNETQFEEFELSIGT